MSQKDPKKWQKCHFWLKKCKKWVSFRPLRFFSPDGPYWSSWLDGVQKYPKKRPRKSAKNLKISKIPKLAKFFIFGCRKPSFFWILVFFCFFYNDQNWLFENRALSVTFLKILSRWSTELIFAKTIFCKKHENCQKLPKMPKNVKKWSKMTKNRNFYSSDYHSGLTFWK